MAHRLTIVEIEEAEGMSALEILEDEMFGTRIGVPAMCSEGCEVELDGICQHGFKSLAMHMGVV